MPLLAVAALFWVAAALRVVVKLLTQLRRMVMDGMSELAAQVENLTARVAASVEAQQRGEALLDKLQAKVQLGTTAIADLTAQLAASTGDPAKVAELAGKLKENNDWLAESTAELVAKENAIDPPAPAPEAQPETTVDASAPDAEPTSAPTE